MKHSLKKKIHGGHQCGLEIVSIYRALAPWNILRSSLTGVSGGSRWSPFFSSKDRAGHASCKCGCLWKMVYTRSHKNQGRVIGRTEKTVIRYSWPSVCQKPPSLSATILKLFIYRTAGVCSMGLCMLWFLTLELLAFSCVFEMYFLFALSSSASTCLAS